MHVPCQLFRHGSSLEELPLNNMFALQIPRVAGAILMAPFVDKGLSWVEQKLQLNSKRKAFLVVTLSCIGMTALVFGILFCLMV